MGKLAHFNVGIGRAQGKCIRCGKSFVGPVDRCETHKQELRQRRRRKPR